VELTREGNAEGKIDVWVVELGGSGKMSRVDTHVVRLSLEPVTVGEKRQIVGDALISRQRSRPE
jgi:hypothetical protein